MADHILEMRGICKYFSGVRALEDVNFQVERGTIHALVGENGAGKSTLMNVLSGVYPHGTYEGDIVYENEVCKFGTIGDSEEKGIVIIHQELALIPEMTIGENMFLGNERGKKFWIDWDETYAEAEKHIRTVGLKDPVHTYIRDIGVGKQQLVEIAKALAKNAKLLILDEPTSSLNETDSQALLDLLLAFKEQGMTSIIISHKLNEVSYVADAITVLRDGHTVETMYKAKNEIDEDRIIRGMVGREIADRFPGRPESNIGEVSMSIKDWTVYHPEQTDRKVVDNISMQFHRGEVVGISGLMGAGRTELAMSIFGNSYGKFGGGTLELSGEAVQLRTVREAIRAGIAYVTEDRKGNGLILSDAIRVNTSLANLEGVSTYNIIDPDKEQAVALEYREKMRTKCHTVEQAIGSLSGGNQQKVLLAKWLFTDPDILILDEPTRGIDVGAKYEIYCIINAMVAEGKTVIIISSELPEVLGMSDRVYVMNEGKIVGEFDRSEATQEKIMAAIIKQ